MVGREGGKEGRDILPLTSLPRYWHSLMAGTTPAVACNTTCFLFSANYPTLSSTYLSTLG